MTDSVKGSNRSPQPPSFIPVISPRPVPARSALPSSLSVPQLALAPPSRQKTPTNGSPASNSSASPNSAGISSLRSLRNFLPFGNKVPFPTIQSNASNSKSQFTTPRRASTSHNERRSMSSHARLDNEPPIIHIDSRRSEQVSRSHFVRSMPDVHKSLPLPPPMPVRVDPDPPVIESSIIPIGTDLSTILESETSGISRHIPLLDESQDEHQGLPKFSTPADSSMLQGPPSSGRKSTGQESDGMDLSTSELRNEVMVAMKQDGAGKHWTNGVIVDDPNDSVPLSTKPSPGAEQFLRRNESNLDLESLDPDLAALLSPNNYKFADSDPALLAAVSAIPPLSLSPSQSPEPRPVLSDPSSSLNTSTSSSLGKRSPTSTTRPLEGHGPRRPSYHSRNTASTTSSSSSLTRPGRSNAAHLSPVYTEEALRPDSPSYAHSDPTIINDTDRKPSASSDGGSRRRQHPPSPLREAHPPLEKQTTGDDWSSKNPRLHSRYNTPSRPSTAVGSTSASGRHFATVSASGWEPDAISPSSRAPSSMSGASSRRPHHPRPSMDNTGRGSVERERIAHVRTRRRSTSLGGNYLTPKLGGPPGVSRSATDWLGPRTAKAFAAAGLIDNDREGSNTTQGNHMSRYGSVRSSLSDRDSRSQYAPSRMAFSEIAGSVSSWGSRSGRVTTPDGQMRPPLDSPTFSNTTRALSPSTAPTSLSTAPSIPQQHQTEVETLKERHAMETEALLSALADSQRTAKMLREENTQLRDRVSEVELQMNELLEQLRRQQAVPPPSSTFLQHYQSPRNVFSRIGSPELPISKTQTRISGLRSRDRSPRETISSPVEETRALPEPCSGHHRRRSSTTSSVFRLPPSNMSMLMNEEDKAVPSGTGNISPTSTSFSTMPGSPGSLNLRPEHEMHLGDLGSLDLDLGFDDDDGYSLSEHR
ncbi:hypothetical protein NEOLEDRAFT_727685 [Neolentinus lepideus HHB14362 ss-1]|uniref:Uncharacterized protein n=1 Tax=Neolentinus lepideus HHB14362 ss-1 TaxID=1314782 RepID=A0A165Q0F1_9AGAM|nr:hypothetical protein NEOLEDRAFT_727685 [Neolentinus lepideus HHB14362 ss-1]